MNNNVYDSKPETMVFNYSKRLLIGIGVLSLILIAFFLVIRWSVLTVTSSVHPSDQKLEKLFKQYKSEFNQLVIMSEVDSRVVRIAPTFTWLDDNASFPRPESKLGFSTERWNEYRQLFKKIGLENGLTRSSNSKTIYFFASSEGTVTGGSSKGFVYSMNNLTPLYDSLDSLDFNSVRIAYKKIDDNWYLFYQAE